MNPRIQPCATRVTFPQIQEGVFEASSFEQVL
jgi:hypothetical protein